MRLASSIWPRVLLILVRSEVVQVFPLEVNMRAAELSAQVGAMEHRRGATAEMGVKMVQFGIESRVIPVAKIGFGQFVQHVFQRIGHKLSAVGTEKPSASAERATEAAGETGVERASTEEAFMMVSCLDGPSDDTKNRADDPAAVDGVRKKRQPGPRGRAATTGKERMSCE